MVQSIIAAEVGYHDLALRYFLASLFADLADRHSNTSDGVHVASAGGVWSALVAGFSGFRDLGNGVRALDPRLPDGWDALVFRLTLRGTRVRVTVRREQVVLAIEDGEGPVRFTVRDEQVEVTTSGPVAVTLDGQGPRIEGAPPSPVGMRRGDGTVIAAIVPSGDGEGVA